MKICELLLVFVALLLAVSMEKWKSCTSHSTLLPLALFRLDCSSVTGSGSGPGLCCFCIAHAATKLIGFSATARHGCCLNKFGALIMLYTSSSRPPPLPPPSHTPPSQSRSAGQALFLGFQCEQGRISRAQRIDRPMARDRLSRDYVVWKMVERTRQRKRVGEGGREGQRECMLWGSEPTLLSPLAY